MHGDDYRCLCPGMREVGFEPCELRWIDERLPSMIVGGLDGVEDDEVPAFVIEGVVGLAHAVFIHFLGVAGVGGGHAAGGQDAEDIVIADGVMEGHAEGLLGRFVKIEDGVGASAIDAERVEDVVTAHDGEVGIERGDFFVAELAAVGCVEFGLDVGVGEEDEVEMGGCGGVGGPGGFGRDGCGGGGEGGGFQEVAAG